MGERRGKSGDLVHLRHSAIDRDVAVFPVHVVVASTRVVAHPDAVVGHCLRLLLIDLEESKRTAKCENLLRRPCCMQTSILGPHADPHI